MIMSYHEAMEYIHNTPKVTSLGLETITRMLNIMGNPEKELKFIHVAGTNGKGSTCTFISEMLMELGYSVGLYTSPYLEEFNERIRLNRQNISNDDLINVLSKVKNAVDIHIKNGGAAPTEFEIITALAYQYYKDQKVDYVVLEVGLGGDRDATNTIIPIVSVITSISLDHTDLLGDNVEDIAAAKAGIIKENIPAVLFQQDEVVQQVIANRAAQMNSKLYITDFESIQIKEQDIHHQIFDAAVLDQTYQDIKISLLGDHQIKNFITALTAMKVLEQDGAIEPISKEQILKSAARSKWGGRAELIYEKPITILDGAHNYDGAKVLSEYIQKYLANQRVILVFGMLKDKDINGVASLLVPLADEIVFTIPHNPRAAEAEYIHQISQPYFKSKATYTVKETIQEAVSYAQNQGETRENTAIVYAGSLYMIGEARTLIRAKYQID